MFCVLQVLSAVFYAFEERPGKGVCVAEIVGGLSLLCAGNKSSKLAVSIEALATSRVCMHLCETIVVGGE